MCYSFTKTAVENSSFDYNHTTTSDTLYEGLFFTTAIIQNMFNFMSDYMVTPHFSDYELWKKSLTLCLGKYSMLYKYSAKPRKDIDLSS